MNNKKIVISLIISIITLITMIGYVNAADYPFTFTVNPTQVTAKLGDTITVDLGMADIDQNSDGINAIQGDITYDERLFESVEIVTEEDNWSVTVNQLENSDLKGRFVISNLNSAKTTGVVAQLKAKIRSDATVSTGVINLKDVFSSYGTTDTEKTSKTITVTITTQNQTTQNPSSSSTSSSTPGTTQKSSNTNNISNSSNLPKTGLSSWLSVGIVISIIGAIVGYIKYKKIY